ncbi:MAG: hypothetical protein P1Q69_15025 [Candidatus Thorarchaeota archaeon]|nr:hypothetical protein [Candidatus Thorarchaeota archaeon]
MDDRSPDRGMGVQREDSGIGRLAKVHDLLGRRGSVWDGYPDERYPTARPTGEKEE